MTANFVATNSLPRRVEIPRPGFGPKEFLRMTPKRWKRSVVLPGMRGYAMIQPRRCSLLRKRLHRHGYPPVHAFNPNAWSIEPLRGSDRKSESLAQKLALIASIAQAGMSPTLGGALDHGSGCFARARPASKAARISFGLNASGLLPISTSSGIAIILKA